jgi:uncharacterized Zn-finger protein
VLQLKQQNGCTEIEGDADQKKTHKPGKIKRAGKEPVKDVKTPKKSKHSALEFRKEVCPQCGKLYSHSSMKVHAITHIEMSDKEKPFQCNECTKGFKFSSALSKHKATHSTKERKFNCEFCEFTFNTQDGRRYHVKSKHMDIKPFNCKLCSIMRFTKNNLLVQYVDFELKRCFFIKKKNHFFQTPASPYAVHV